MKLNFKKLQEVILQIPIYAYVCEKVLGNAWLNGSLTENIHCRFSVAQCLYVLFLWYSLVGECWNYTFWFSSQVVDSMDALDKVVQEREDALRLLQTGQEKARPGAWRRDIFGRIIWYIVYVVALLRRKWKSHVSFPCPISFKKTVSILGILQMYLMQGSPNPFGIPGYEWRQLHLASHFHDSVIYSFF